MGGLRGWTLVEQRIRNWGSWPQDVEPTIRRWNKSKGLSFAYGHGLPTYNRVPYFKCDDCGRFIACRAADRCVLHGKSLCEDCLIDRARSAAYVVLDGAA